MVSGESEITVLLACFFFFLLTLENSFMIAFKSNSYTALCSEDVPRLFSFRVTSSPCSEDDCFGENDKAPDATEIKLGGGHVHRPA